MSGGKVWIWVEYLRCRTKVMEACDDKWMTKCWLCESSQSYVLGNKTQFHSNSGKLCKQQIQLYIHICKYIIKYIDNISSCN